MAETPIEELVPQIASGAVDVADVPLSQCADVAEALADEELVEPLAALVTRVLPRLVKKERLEVIERLWFACCTAEAFALEALLPAMDRLAARGQGEMVEEHLTLLAESLTDAGRVDDAIDVALQGLGMIPASSLLDAAAAAMEIKVGEPSAHSAAVLERLRKAKPEPDSVLAASRALEYGPGTFVIWPDLFLAQIVSTDGHEATVRHPSGTEEQRRVDGTPAPRRLRDDSHEVLRLFDPERLKAFWLEDPARALISLLEGHGGSIHTIGLTEVLSSHVLGAQGAEEALETLRQVCTQGDPELPTYTSRRRLFVAPGVTPPKPKKSRKAPKKVEPILTKVQSQPSDDGPVTRVDVKWVDLTRFPEIRALLSNVEKDVAELTHELAVDLPVRLEEARAHGDLKENAEYEAAKDRQSLVEARIEQLREWLGKLHELAHLRLVPGHVTLMSEVLVVSEETGEERRLRIVPAELPAPKEGDVSAGTPYAKALLSREAGDTVVVKLPKRTERLDVVEVVDPVSG